MNMWYISDPIKCDHLKHIIYIKQNSTTNTQTANTETHTHTHASVSTHSRRSVIINLGPSTPWPIVCNNEPRMYVSFAAANKFDIGAPWARRCSAADCVSDGHLNFPFHLHFNCTFSRSSLLDRAREVTIEPGIQKAEVLVDFAAEIKYAGDFNSWN